jgi:hypothetical protein
MANWQDPPPPTAHGLSDRQWREADELHDAGRDRDTAALSELDRLAREWSDGLLHIHQTIRNSEGRHAIQWHYDWANDSWLRFVNKPGWFDTLAAAVRYELDDLKERVTMNIFGTELFPYIQGEMLADNEATMTISDVKVEELVNNRGENSKPVVYFKERDKGLILNKTNARVIAALYGPETDDWIGERITLYAERGTWFGKSGYAVRVNEHKPRNGRKNGRAAEPVEVEELPFETETPPDNYELEEA